MISNIARRWKTLSGHNKWQGLLYPLDKDLQQYIIHYGERAQATYDTFNTNTVSKWCGSSKFAKRDLFSRVGLEKGNPYKYKVVKYLYATSSATLPESVFIRSKHPEGWCIDSNFMGYVAVATDEGKQVLGRRDILVAWRGTKETVEWVKDFETSMISAEDILGNVGYCQIHYGLHSLYTSANPQSRCNKTSARQQVLQVVRQLVDTYSNEEISISIAGHSLGAMFATISAADIVANGYNKPNNKGKHPCPVTGFVFGSPLVGDSNFRDVFHSMEQYLSLLRVHNAPDIVPLYPPLPGYLAVGEELMIESRNSPYVNFPGDLISWHDLEASYLHRLAGTQMANGEFILDVNRDISLINKYTAALKPEYLQPFLWWGLKNQGMVQQANGSWILDDHEIDDDDPVMDGDE